MELPSGKLTMAVSTQHNAAQEHQLTFWEMKGKQMLTNQPIDPGEEESYPDKAHHFSFDDTCI